MFEEASGIHKYRNQRKEALRNLLKTSDDLQRISDLVMEKERMVKMLARHVTKAKKYREYSDELTRLDVALCSRRFRDQSEKIKEISRAHATLITEKEKLSAQVATAETMIEEKELFVLEKEEKLRQSNQAVREITEQIHTIENSMVSKQEKIEGAKRAIQQIDLYQNKSKETINKLKEEHAFIEGEIITFETKIKEAEAAYTACKSEFDQFEQEVAKKRLELNKTNQQKINLMEEEAELRSRREKVKSTSDMLLESKMNIQRSIGEEKKHLDECHEQIRKYKASLKEVSEEHENLSASREALLVKIDEKEDKYKSIFEEEKTLEATLISDEKKLEFVEEMKKNHEGYKEAVRSVIEGNISGISGIVADIINVDPAYMVPIEAALGSRVQYVLADSEGAAQAAIDYLREGKLGKASFVIHNAVKGVNRPAHLEDLGHIEGVIGWADNFVTFQRNYEALGSLLLGDVLLIKDIAVMEKVKATCGDFTVYCLTPDGRSFTTHGIVRGGFGSEELGLLSRTKFIEHLNESINRCKSQIDSKEREKKASLLTIEEAKKALLEIDEWLNADRRAKQEHEGNIRHLDEEIMRIQARENDALEQIHAIDRRLEEVHEEEKQIERSLEIMDEKKTETESIILISAEILDQFEEKRHTMTEKLKNAEIEFSSVKQEMENRKRELGRVADSINHAYETLTADKEARNKSEIEIETLRKEIEDIKVQHSELSIVKREKEQNAGKRHEDLAVLRNEIGEFRKAEREKEKTLNAAKDKLHECEMNLERLTERRRNMVERIYEEYERDLNSLTEEETRIEMDENEAKEKIEVLRKRLKQIGPNVNLGVLEDYERENKTFEETRRPVKSLFGPLTRSMRTSGTYFSVFLKAARLKSAWKRIPTRSRPRLPSMHGPAVKA
jgi:chromosome segregation protein